MDLKKRFIAFVLSIIIAFFGCSGGGGGGGSTVKGLPPSIVVLAPTGGEILKGGGIVNITWNASDDQALGTGCITIMYSNGSKYLNVASDLDNTGLYAWTMPLIDSSSVTVKVTVKDSDGNSVSAVSADFIIDSTQPVLSGVGPATNPASVADGGSTPISFSATDTNLGSNYITIEYNDGGGYIEIITGLENSDSPWDWYVPGGLTTANIRITATDAAGNIIREVATGQISSDADATAPSILSINYGIPGSSSGMNTLDGQVAGLGDYFTVVFSETMERTSAEAAFSLTPAPAGIEFYWLTTTKPDDTLVAVPTEFLIDQGQAYTLDVADTAEDLATNSLTVAGSASFTTPAADKTKPVLLTINSNNEMIGSDGAGSSLLTLGGGIFFFVYTFDENVDPASGTFKLENGISELMSVDYNSTGVYFSVADQVAVFMDLDKDGTTSEPEDALPAGRGYKLTLENIKDLNGNEMRPIIHEFVTAGDGTGTEDPYLLSSFPADGEVGAAVNLPIRLIFSEALDYSTIDDTNITVSAATAGALTIRELNAESGFMVGIYVDGGLPVDDTITVTIDTAVTDTDGNGLPADETVVFDTGSVDDTAPPQIYSSSIADGFLEVSPWPVFLVNLSEEFIPSTVDRTKVTVRDKLTGVRINAFELNILGDPEREYLQLYHSGLGSGLSYERTYSVEIADVEDLNGNPSVISFDFTTGAAAGDSPPMILAYESEMMVYPPFIFGLDGEQLKQRLQTYLILFDADGDIDTVTVTDGTTTWDLYNPTGAVWVYSDIDADIAIGPGQLTYTITDDLGFVTTFKHTYFMPDEYPTHVSPVDGESITTDNPVTLSWTAPSYNNSFIALGLSPDPAGFFGGSTFPPLFVNGNETSVTVPDEFGLYPSWYFWSIIQAVFGYDIMTVTVVMEPGPENVFIYEDTALPTISGTITQIGGMTSGQIFVILDDGGINDAPHAVTVVDDIGAYTIPNVVLANGFYSLRAFRDANGDMEENDGEGITLSPLVVNWQGTDLLNQNLTLEENALGSISGDIQHSAVNGGLETGKVIIYVDHLTQDEYDQTIIVDGPGPYTIEDLPDGDYNITAWRDSYFNMVPQSGEGAAVYGANPVNISGGNDQAGIDIDLVEIP